MLAAPLRSPARSMPERSRVVVQSSKPFSPNTGLGGGKAFQDVELWEREVLDIELKNHEVLTFAIGVCPRWGRRGGM